MKHALAALLAAIPVSTLAAQDVLHVKSRAEIETWLTERWAQASKQFDGNAWVAIFPPLTIGNDRSRTGSSPAGEFVVDLVLKTMPKDWQRQAVYGSDLIQVLGRFMWGGADYDEPADANLLGAATSCDLSIGGSLEPTRSGVRLTLAGYHNGAEPGPNGLVQPVFKQSFELVQSRKLAKNRDYKKFLRSMTDFDGQVRTPFGANPGAASGQALTQAHCELLLPRMLGLLTQRLAERLATKGVDFERAQLAILPILRGRDAPFRQFSLRIEQAFLENFENAWQSWKLHDSLARYRTSALWYATEKLEPGILDLLAEEQDISGFFRGSYSYVAGSGRIVLELEYYDESCRMITRVRRALEDPRMVAWMNENLEKPLTQDESDVYAFADPEVSLLAIQESLVDAMNRALSVATKKLKRKDIDIVDRPIFLRPAAMPGSEKEEQYIERLYQILDQTSDRVVARGVQSGMDADEALAKIECTVGGKTYPSYQAAYLDIVENIGLAFDCSAGQVFRGQVTEFLYDELVESEIGEELDVILPPSLAEGDFEVDESTLILHPRVQLTDTDNGQIRCVVRLIDAAKPSRSLGQKSIKLNRRLTQILAPQLLEATKNASTPQLTPFLQGLLSTAPQATNASANN